MRHSPDQMSQEIQSYVSITCLAEQHFALNADKLSLRTKKTVKNLHATVAYLEQGSNNGDKYSELQNCFSNLRLSRTFDKHDE